MPTVRNLTMRRTDWVTASDFFPVILRLVRFVLVFVLLAACSGGPRAPVQSAVEAGDVALALERYERFRAREGIDEYLLREIARVVLERAATGSDPVLSDAALSQLALAGTAGQPILEDLADDASTPVVQAKALRLLADRGHRGARSALRGLLDSDDADVLAAAVSTLDGDDESRLLSLSEHSAAVVRASAAQRLSDAVPSTDARLALEEIARMDPVVGVRVAAVISLAAFGPKAFDAIRARLSDTAARVRMTAVSALVRSDRSRAIAVLGVLLRVAPSKAGVEAARVLSRPRSPGTEEETVDVIARSFLYQTLEAGDPRLRAQAAVALSTLPWDDVMTDGLVDRMRTDPNQAVRLSLALLLVESNSLRASALSTLRALALARSSMPAVQASAALASRGDPVAIRRLESLLDSEPAPIRRVAARALARRAGKPDAARQALLDRDGGVRVAAAGGILASAHH